MRNSSSIGNIGDKVALPLGDLPVVSTYLMVIKTLLLVHLFQSGSTHMSSAGVFH